MATSGTNRAALDELITTLSPIVYFHPNERFFPVDMNDLLAVSTLYVNDKPMPDKVTNRLLAEITPKVRKEFNIDKYGGFPWQILRIEYPKHMYKGSLKAPMYVLTRELADRIEIYYFAVFAYNGPRKILKLTNAGGHEGDLEHVTISLDKATMQPIEMYFGAHRSEDGKWVPWDQVQKEGTHPIALSALDGHGFYPDVGYAFRLFGLSNDEVDFGPRWQPQLERLYFNKDREFNVDTMGWAIFGGRIGRDGISSLLDKPFWATGKEERNVKPPVFRKNWLNTLNTVFSWYVVLGILLAFFGIGMYQKRMSKPCYFSLTGSFLVTFVLVFDHIVSKLG